MCFFCNIMYYEKKYCLKYKSKNHYLSFDNFQWPSLWRFSSAGLRFTHKGLSPYSGPVMHRPVTWTWRIYRFSINCMAFPRTSLACSTMYPPPSIQYCTISCHWNSVQLSRYVGSYQRFTAPQRGSAYIIISIGNR